MKVLSYKIVKTRKQHQCFSCLRYFPEKTEMTSCTFIADGSIWTKYQCEDCHELFDEDGGLFKDEDGGFVEGCVNEKLHDFGVSTPEELLIMLKKETGEKNATFSSKN